MPIMLARNGHAYTACVARELADVGYCSAKKIYFHGVRLHSIAARRVGSLQQPQQLWLREGSAHDGRSVKEQKIYLPDPTLINDKPFSDEELEDWFGCQNTKLVTPIKKPRGKELTKSQKIYNHAVNRLRQPIEVFFNWLDEKTKIQISSKVRYNGRFADVLLWKTDICYASSSFQLLIRTY